MTTGSDLVTVVCPWYEKGLPVAEEYHLLDYHKLDVCLPVEATKASCRVSGCLCRDRGPRYPSDATDAEWELLRPQAQAVMAELRRGPGGRPMEHDLRAVLDAIGYVTRYGIEWRALPVGFRRQAVYAFFQRWNARGLPQGLVDRLPGRLRVACGRAELPTAGSIDSQSVKVGGHRRGCQQGFRCRESCRVCCYAGLGRGFDCSGWSAGVVLSVGPA